jgi:hypothetical protein
MKNIFVFTITSSLCSFIFVIVWCKCCIFHWSSGLQLMSSCRLFLYWNSAIYFWEGFCYTEILLLIQPSTFVWYWVSILFTSSVYVLDAESSKNNTFQAVCICYLKKYENVSWTLCVNTNLLTFHILVGRSQIFHVLKVYEKCLESCGRIMLRCVMWELFLKVEGGRVGTEYVLCGGLRCWWHWIVWFHYPRVRYLIYRDEPWD